MSFHVTLVPVSTICQDCTLMLPDVIVNWFPVKSTSAEAPATAVPTAKF